ncbi:MAG: thermonuclease family protein [Syntrophales bacterium]
MSNVQRRKHIANDNGEPYRKPPLHQAGVWRFLCLLPVLTILVVLSSLSGHAAPIRTVTATITKISDGDTVQAVTPEGTKLKVRLYGIDAPETAKGKIHGEPFGNASRDYLASLVSQRSVRVEILDIDRYRRMVAILWLAERNVNQEMIAAGMAEAYGEYLKKPYRVLFLQAEQEAKAQGRGVWSQGSSYERPSQFRRRMGM